MKSYLFVVAHPDDEVLGGGATIHRLIRDGHDVSVCILSNQCNTRYDKDLGASIAKSHKRLGIVNSYIGGFKCLCFKDEPHHEMVQFIENAILKSRADVVFTHHPTDLNDDHYYASKVCQEAARLPQRLICKCKPIEALFFMEVQSSTDWTFNRAWKQFEPDTFVGVSEDDLMAKMSALDVYDNVIRDIPHPRSLKGIESLARYRGTQGGYEFAEAFECVFRRGV